MRSGAIGTAGLAMGVPPSFVAPSDRITIGMIGAGARAHQLVEAFKKPLISKLWPHAMPIPVGWSA